MSDPKARSVEYTLEWPIDFAGEMITKFTVRRPTGKEAFANPPLSPLAMISTLTAQPVEVLRMLDIDDVEGLSEVVEGFRRRGRPTGDGPIPS